jgi:four helix bundle protein
MRDHKLRAFQLGDQVALAIYKQSRSFPREEMFGLTSQLRRAAVSIASNIVEGAARSSEAEYVHFLDTAYDSAREVEYQVSLAFRLGFLPEPAHQELSTLTVETSKVPNGLLHSLRKLWAPPVSSLPITYDPCDDVAPTPDYENVLTD